MNELFSHPKWERRVHTICNIPVASFSFQKIFISETNFEKKKLVDRSPSW
jgi:hypothetical protein